MAELGGPIGSGTESCVGDPVSGPGTNCPFDVDERLDFLFLLFVSGPENASSSEQKALLMAPLLEAKFFSEISDPAHAKNWPPGKRSMKSVDILLWCLFIVGIVIAFLAWRFDRKIENFASDSSDSGIDFAKMSMQAMDSAPTTSELKNHYKSLLIYVDDKFKNGSSNVDNDKDQGGRRAMCLISSLGQVLYNRPGLREDFVVEDVMRDWPKWISPLDPTIK